MDLRLYNIDNSTMVSLDSDILESSSTQQDKSNGIEVLANKVVKFLLTIQGSDITDPDYGCTLPGYTLISDLEVPRLQLQLVADIERCARYIKTTEYAGSDADMDIRLASIELIKLSYDKSIARDTLQVYIRITAKSAEEAVLQIPVGSGV